MPRVKRGTHAKKRHKKILALAKGYTGAKSRTFRAAKEQVMHSLAYAYRDRRAKKREFRKLWITRINAAAREQGLSYNRLISGLKTAGVDIDRKILAEIAVSDPEGFAKLAGVARETAPAVEARTGAQTEEQTGEAQAAAK